MNYGIVVDTANDETVLQMIKESLEDDKPVILLEDDEPVNLLKNDRIALYTGSITIGRDGFDLYVRNNDEYELESLFKVYEPTSMIYHYVTITGMISDSNSGETILGSKAGEKNSISNIRILRITI